MNNSKNTIAFFWVGEDNEIPTCFVKSIHLTMGNEVNIVQLTDRKTKDVLGVSSIKRFDLSDQIMIARLEAYSKYIVETENTFFCDADSILINKVSLPKNSNKNIFLSERQLDFKISYTYPEFYEEFIDKTAKEVMPFLFGLVATKNNQQDFFKKLLDICQKLPSRFHRWYGDQYSLKIHIERDNIHYEKLNLDKYLIILKTPLTLEKLRYLYKANSQFITFKGPKSKIYVQQALSLYEFFVKK